MTPRGKKFSPEEIAVVRRMHGADEPYKIIAHAIGRTEVAIEQHVARNRSIYGYRPHSKRARPARDKRPAPPVTPEFNCALQTAAIRESRSWRRELAR